MKILLRTSLGRRLPSFTALLLSAAVASALFGCGGSAMHAAPAEQAMATRGPLPMAPSQPSPVAGAPATPDAIARVSTNAASVPTSSPGASKAASKTDAPSAAFLILYTGSVSMMVDEGKLADAIDKIVDVAEAEGGHLAGRTDASVTLKVPSARFRSVLSQTEQLGTVTHRSVTAEDVTEEFKDAEVRLQNLRATRTRLQEFMAKTTSVSDMLTIEQQLERVSMDIDRIEGRMRFLRERTAFSTITVNLSAKPRELIAKETPPPPPAPIVAIDLPVKWLEQLGSDRLMQVKK